MLGNITLASPLERLYGSTFQRGWDRTIQRIMRISPGDLEEMDCEIRKLERYYELSGFKKINASLGFNPDIYSQKLNVFKSNLSDGIVSRFRSMSQKIMRLVGDPESISDFERDRKKLDEALSVFRMLRAFYRRWKIDRGDYLPPGMRDGLVKSMRNLAFTIAKKHSLLMKEHKSIADDVELAKKSRALEQVESEVMPILDWYSSSYLNIDSKNRCWSGDCSGAGLPVLFFDEDHFIAPLERLKNVPSSVEMIEIQEALGRFTGFYTEHGLVGRDALDVIGDYFALKEQLASVNSDKCVESALFEKILSLHRVNHDAKSRIESKDRFEDFLSNGFVSYFAPVDEVYRIIERGFISSEDSVFHKFSGKNYNNLVFSMGAEIKDGDVGFIFPASKVLEGSRFFISSDGSDKLHVFSGSQGLPLKIEISKGIFVAPKDRIVRYRSGNDVVRETSESYFRKFFSALPAKGSWLGYDSLQDWLSLNCAFYDYQTMRHLNGLLGDVSAQKQTSLNVEHVPGSIKPTNYYVEHTFESISDEQKSKLDSDTFNLTLFEWIPKQ